MGRELEEQREMLEVVDGVGGRLQMTSTGCSTSFGETRTGGVAVVSLC